MACGDWGVGGSQVNLMRFERDGGKSRDRLEIRRGWIRRGMSRAAVRITSRRRHGPFSASHKFSPCRCSARTALQHAEKHCSSFQHTAPHCCTLQHTATHCCIAGAKLCRTSRSATCAHTQATGSATCTHTQATGPPQRTWAGVAADSFYVPLRNGYG